MSKEEKYIYISWQTSYTEKQILCIKEVKFEYSKLKSLTSLNVNVFLQHEVFSKGRYNS